MEILGNGGRMVISFESVKLFSPHVVFMSRDPICAFSPIKTGTSVCVRPLAGTVWLSVLFSSTVSLVLQP